MSTRFIIPFVIACCMLAAGCSRPSHPTDSTLQRAEALADRHYAEAAECLDSIDRATLSAHDRHFYDFLSLKVADKAYTRHTSDSIILSLIDYAARRHDAHYAETLYYGGRVYSDLGDYPTALQYFHKALDALPDDDSTLLLRGNILSQTGRLLSDLRLYDEAAPYIEAVINLNRLQNDSINEVYDLQLLAYNYLSSEKYDKADSTAHLALEKSMSLPEHHQAWSKMLIAGAKHKKNEIDSALSYIRDTPYKVEPDVHTTALAYGCLIYNNADIPDSAYHYAIEIINNDTTENRILAYHMLLLPQLRLYSSQSELDNYLDKYSHLMEDYYNENNNRLAIAQQAFYNYSLHDRAREKAERAAYHLREIIVVTIFLAMLFVLIALFYKNKMKNKIISLQQKLELFNRLKHENKFTKDNALNIHEPVAQTLDNLRKKLVHEFELLANETDNNIPVTEALMHSEAYILIQEYIKRGKSLSEDSDLWLKLDNAIAVASPKFNLRINILTGGKISLPDYHTLLLIKCGCTTTEIANLMSRSENAILSRREKLSLRMFDRKLGTRPFDAIIRKM